MLLCCVWPLGNLTLIHLPTCVSGYRKLKDGDTSVLTPSLLQGQKDGELKEVYLTAGVKSKLWCQQSNQLNVSSADCRKCGGSKLVCRVIFSLFVVSVVEDGKSDYIIFYFLLLFAFFPLFLASSHTLCRCREVGGVNKRWSFILFCFFLSCSENELS